MTKLQFRVLYREFFFRMVDLELLSAHALGDSNRLLGQFASLLVFLSIILTLPANPGRGTPAQRTFLMFGFEHFVISTTMLVVGLFAVLSWDSTFPNRRDVLVLAPLPVRPRTFFLAKVAAVSSALGITLLALHALPGVVWPLTLAVSAPAVTAPALTWDPALPPASAADMKAILDRDLADPLTVGAMAPGLHAGLVVGVVKSGARSVLAYGSAKPDSIFEIGSVSKTLTGLMLARMVKQGKVRLDQPLRELLPSGLVSKPAGNEITLVDLATHHSGLPELPGNLDFQGKPNPGADYHLENLYAYLKGRGVEKRLDVPFEYSNLDVGLLGTALAQQAGLTYEELLRQQIAGPLGMADTALSLSPEQQGRLIQAYGRQHFPLPAWELDVLAPAGSILSTGGDMLTFVAANLHPEKISPEFAAAVKESQIQRSDIATDMGMALAWVVDTGSRTYWHNGLISGYNSYVFFCPQRDYAGVVLFNTSPDLVPFADLVGQHVRQRLAGEPAVSLASMRIPANAGGWGTAFRAVGAYWVTMVSAGLCIFCFVLGLQGLSMQLLPRRLFLRVSSFLQLAAFGAIVAVYFTQPIVAAPDALMRAQGSGLLSWSPSYWFLGVLQELNGSPALAGLARRAWIALAVVVSVTAVSYALSYFRTLRKIVEEPDITPGIRTIHWLPPFGDAPRTAIVHFSMRTLMRSRQHRVILAFYLSIGFAMTIFLLRSPEMTERILDTAASNPWHQVSIPILAATLIMTIASVVGVRVLFSMPLDLRANWVFQITSRFDGRLYMVAARRSLLALSVIPVAMATAALCFYLWPWQPALAHVAALGLFGMLLADVCLYSFRKIPFTCSYLPGKSQVHMVILSALLLLYVTLFAVKYERQMLTERANMAALLVILAMAVTVVRWRSVVVAQEEATWVRFEDAPADQVLVLGLADPRHLNQ